VAQPVTAAAPVPLSPCADSDHGPQTLTSLTVSPSVLDVRRHGGRLQVAATIVDTGGPGPARGAASIDVRIVDFPESPFGLGATTLRASADGTFRGVIPVPRGIRPGVYQRLRVEVHPASADRYFHDRFTEVNPDVYESFDLAAAGLQPAVRILSHRDRRAPRITSLTVSRTSVDVRRHVARLRATVRVHDAGSGVDNATVTVGGVTEIRLVRRGHGRWVGSAMIRRFESAGQQHLSVDAEDRVGRSAELGPGQLRRRGWPSTVRMRGGIDTVKPIFRILRRPAPVMDLRSGDGQAVTLIRAVDRGSGVQFVGLGIFDGEVEPQPGMLVSGDRHNGVWRVVVPLPRCETHAARWTDTLSVRDRAFNEVVRKVRYRVVNTDVVPPAFADLVGTVRPAGPVTVQFSEPVTGISDLSAPIRPNANNPLRSRRPALGTPEPGTWTCLTASGAALDCATGAYRLARWVPATALQQGGYVVDINPDHNLDVTDLAGNPFNGSLVFSQTNFSVSTSPPI
jgi:hypothetical protein